MNHNFCLNKKNKHPVLHVYMTKKTNTSGSLLNFHISNSMDGVSKDTMQLHTVIFYKDHTKTSSYQRCIR